MQIGEKLIKLLDKNDIPYQLSGKNVQRGNITIQCPYCGSDDTGYHMGINLEDGAFSCWRNHDHRGRNLARLVAYLLRITIEQARSELGLGVFEADEYDQALLNLFAVKDIDDANTPIGKVEYLNFDKEFRQIENSGMRERFWNYLVNRGFKDPRRLAVRFDLRCALSGDFKNRIIIPVYIDGAMQTWTARAIDPKAQLRYKDLEIAKSVRHCKYCIFDFDNVKRGGDILFIVEGPFDAMNLTYNLEDDFKATCLFTLRVTDEQKLLLASIMDRYEKVVVLFDKGTLAQGISFISEHFPDQPNMTVIQMPEGVKDPGDLRPEQVRQLAAEVAYFA